MKKHFFSFLIFIISLIDSYGQCGAGTPVFIVDLSADPNANWTSDLIIRNDTCCGSTSNCVQFIVTLNPLAEGILFDVCEGALPGGALFYEVDCGGSTPIGNAICLYGVGPHSITFCKPGANANRYCLTSVAEPGAGEDITVAEGCYDTISSIGFEPSSILWRSIYPGALGAYNSYLNCILGCEEVIVTPSANPPPYVDFQVCGFALGLCDISGVCDTVRVYFNDSLNVSISPLNPMVCFGDNTTSITANPTGGEDPFTYLWNTGATSASIDAGIGNYSVIVNDAGGCYSASSSITVGEFTVAISADAGLDQLVCNQNPKIQLNGSVLGVSTGIWKGGNGTFLPSDTSLNALYTPTFQEIINASLSLTLLTTNNLTCPADSDIVTFSFTGFIGIPAIYSDSVSCYQGSDGSALIIINSGLNSYSYLWDDPSNSTDSLLTNVSAGLYNVQVTDSLGCKLFSDITVYEPSAFVLDSLFIQNLTCFNDNSGMASVFVSGGSPPYTYDWGANSNDQTTFQAIDLSAGIYEAIILDAKGCSIDSSISISEPPLLVLTIDSVTINNCFGGDNAQASLSASGGSPAYSYLWDANAGSQTTATATNLSAGTYSVYLFDSHLCSDSLEITIDQPDSLSLITNVLADVDCFGGTEGSAEVIASGGVGPYSYLWDVNAQNQTGSIAFNLAVGIYSVTITDSNLCQSSSQIEILGPDSAFSLTPDIQDVSCFGYSDGAVNMIISGASSPYTYLWDSNAGNQTSPSISDLEPGSYWFWVSDSNNCRDSIQISISEPSELIVNSIFSNVLCNGENNGSALLQVSGGSLPYTYLWDENTGNQNTVYAIDLAAGIYNYVVLDNNDCIVSGLLEITEPEALILTASNDQEICVGTNVEISAQAMGGTGPIIYTWSDLGEGQFQNISPTINSLYYVLAIDSLGCSSNYDSVEVAVFNIFLDSLIVSNSGSICEGETTTISAQYNGQSPILSYSWNHNLGSTYGPLTISPIQSSWYTFTLIDECQNSLSDSTLVEVYPIPVIDIEISVNEGCAPLEVAFSNLPQQENVNYVWVFGDGGASTDESPIYTYEEAGNFLVELSLYSNFGCTSNSSNTSFVHVDPQPISNFNANPWETDISEPLIEFTNSSSSDAIFFTWNFGDGDSIMIENPSHSYSEIGVFNVQLETENVFGCISSIIKTVTINPNHDIIIPNAFTPNINGSQGGFYDPTDLSNDIFYPFADYVSDFHMMIFNRWGELIFESFDIKYGWDGYFKNELAQIGAYVYKIDITFLDGFNNKVQGKVKLMN